MLLDRKVQAIEDRAAEEARVAEEEVCAASCHLALSYHCPGRGVWVLEVLALGWFGCSSV